MSIFAPSREILIIFMNLGKHGFPLVFVSLVRQAG
jgi:hypothetical protein